MSKIILVAVALLVGCAQWSPEEFPVMVDMDDNLSDEQAEAVIAVCEDLNARVGTRFLFPVAGNGRKIQRGRIHVHSGAPNKGSAATAFYTPWSCKIAMGNMAGPDTFAVTMHEILHCLGIAHTDDPTDLMHFDGPYDRELKQSTIDYLKEQVGTN